MPLILRRARAGAPGLLPILLLTALVGPPPAAARPCAHANKPVAAATRSQTRQAVICLIDHRRAAHGLPRLRENSRLDASAQNWTETMVRLGRLTHGANIGTRLDAVGFLWASLGENIGSGFETPRQVFRGWMASLPHCQTILWPDYTRIGVGVVNHGVSGTGPATWTGDFGRPLGTATPSRNYGPERGCPYRP